MGKVMVDEGNAARNEIAGELENAAKVIEFQAEALAGIFGSLPDGQQLGGSGEVLDGLIERLIDVAENVRTARFDVIGLKF